MAERPVFIPDTSASSYVRVESVPFDWNPGFAAVQKRKNVVALHASAASRGLSPLLEISSKSEEELGRRLSSFSLKLNDKAGQPWPLECVFQSAKVYERGGPYVDLLRQEPKAAKRDPRHKTSGPLVEFRYEGRSWKLLPRTAFYDWLYMRALFPHRDYLRRLDKYRGFTDIEFNPNRSINCQARSLAKLVAMQQADVLENAMSSEEAFLAVLSHDQERSEHGEHGHRRSLFE